MQEILDFHLAERRARQDVTAFVARHVARRERGRASHRLTALVGSKLAGLRPAPLPADLWRYVETQTGHTITTDSPPLLPLSADSPQADPETQYRRSLAYTLQRQAARLAPGHRVALCHRLPASSAAVQIRRHEGRAFYSGFQTCGSVWDCPCCAPKITEARRQELQLLVQRHRATGGDVLMLTLTVPHQRHDVLSARAASKRQDVRDVARHDPETGEVIEYLEVQTEKVVSEDHGMISRLTAAYRSFVSGRRALSRVVPGYVGYVRALEVTYGDNGWHPHFHILLLVSAPIDDLDSLSDILWFNWANATRKQQFGRITDAGLNLVAATAAGDKDPVSQYVAKWGVSEELTKLHTKNNGKRSSRTPWQLLQGAACGDDQDAAAWAEYSAAFFGRRQLVPSPGLRQLYGLGPEQSDADLAAAEPEKPEQHEHLYTFERRELVALRAVGSRAVALTCAESGLLQLRQYLDSCVLSFEGLYGPLPDVQAGDLLEEAACLSDTC